MKDKVLKRILSVTLSVVMALPLFPAMVTAAGTTGHWSDPAVKICRDYGVLDNIPYSDPNESITRAEFCRMVNLAFGFTKTEGAKEFSDVDYSGKYGNDIKIASAMGYFAGYGNKAEPSGSLTREMAFSILARIYELSGDATAKTKFSDDADISAWARASMNAMIDGGYISGNPGNTLAAKKALSKGETAQALSAMFGTIIDESLTANTQYKNLTVRKTGITIANAVVSGDLFITDGTGAGDAAFENTVVKGRTLITGGGSNSISFKNCVLDELIMSGKRNTHAKMINSTLKYITFLDSGRVTFQNAEISFNAGTGVLTLSGTFSKITENKDKTVTVTVNGITYTIRFASASMLRSVITPSTASRSGDRSSSGSGGAPSTPTATAPSITTAALPNGTYGSAYSQTLAAAGTAPLTWAVTAGSLPSGLNLDANTGIISGTPTAATSENFTVEAANSVGTATKDLSIDIDPATLTFKADDKTVRVNTVLPQTYTYTVTGWKFSDNDSLVTTDPIFYCPTAVIGTIGTYTITKSNDATINGANYTAVYADGTLSVVAKTPVTITGVTVAGKIYDGNEAVMNSGSLTITGADTGDEVGLKANLEYAYTSTDSGGYSDTIPPTNAGAYRLVVSVPASNADYTGSLTVNFTISKANNTLAISCSDVTYGAAVSPSATTNTSGGTVTYEYKVQGAADNTYTATAPTNAGSYTVRGTSAATANYNAATATANFTINKANNTLVISCSDVTYGAAVSPSATTNTSGGAVAYEYKVQNAADNTYSNTAPTNAGSYTVRGTSAETTNYNAATATTNFNINKADNTLVISCPNITFGGTVSPSVDTNTSGGAVTYEYKVQNADDNTYTATAPTAAGSYTVRGTSAETTNYNAATAITNFNINKADNMLVISCSDVTYGTPVSPSVTTNTSGGAVTYEYKAQAAPDSAYSTTVPTDAGSYIVRGTSAATADYSAAIAITYFNINKADNTLVISCSDVTFGTAVSPSEDTNTSTGAVTYEYKVQGANDNTYTTTAPTDAGSYTVRGTSAETTNYNSATATTNFNISKANNTLVISCSDVTFGGTVSPSATTNASGGAVTYEYKVQNANDNTYSTTVPTAAGSYTVRATSAATANYNSATATVNFTINPAPLTGTPTISIGGGTLKIGAVLTVNTLPLNTQSGLTYQWQADNTDIAGATSSTYTVQAADVGKAIRVTVSTTGNYLGSVTSAATNAVPYTINLVKAGNTGTDDVYFVTSGTMTTYAVSGTVTINYNLDNSGASSNKITYSGTTNTITAVTTVGLGTSTYTVDPADASNGVIIITATFEHISTTPLTVTITSAPTKILTPLMGETSDTFTVTVSGFAVDANANGVTLNMGATTGLSYSGHDTTGNATAGTKTFTVTVTYNGTTAFSTGSANIAINGIIGVSANYTYTGGVKTTSANIRDGQADYTGTGTDRRIPVTQTNVAAFNSYANATEGLTRHYKQTGNIVLGDPVPADASNWTTIGTYTTGNQFTGSYDGGGFTISNLTINATAGYQGMFGYIGTGGTVKNLGLVGGSVSGGNYVGGVAGYVNTGTLQNCYATGNVSGEGAIGGVVGYVSSGSSTVQNCYSTGSVSGSGNHVGGVAGYVNVGNVQNCYATGNVSGSVYVGGVVGQNYGIVQNCYSTGSVSGSNYVGGVVGQNIGGIVQNCAALNLSVTTTATATSSTYLGRVVGRNSSTLSNNYANSTMTIKHSANPDGSGGTAKSPVGNAGDHVDGADVTSTQYKSETWWTQASNSVNWSAVWGGVTADTDKPWKWDEGAQRPILWFETASSPVSRFTVTYNANTANNGGGTAPTDGAQYTSGNPVTVAGFSTLSPAANYRFYEWNTLANGTGTGYQPDDTFNITGNTTLYAIYTNGADASHPLAIRTLAELQGMNTGLSKHYRLMKDITINNADNWQPIGTATPTASHFTGSLDGNGHMVTFNNVTLSVQYAGLFGYIGAGSEVRNITIAGKISSNYNIGTGYLGGVVGYNNGGTVKNCGVTAEVALTATSDSYTGGVVGWNYVFSTSTATVQSCYATGNVMASGGGEYIVAGGVVGLNYGDINNCYATGNVASSGGDRNHAGGVVGYNISHGSPTMVNNCYATGNATASGNGSANYAGGVAGISFAYSGTTAVNNCAGLGGGASASGSTYNYVGRVVGVNSNLGATATIANCYANSAMTIKVGTGAASTVNSTDATSINGANVTLATAKTQAWWTNTLGWNTSTVWGGTTLTATDAKPWIWGTSPYTLPVLYWQTTMPIMNISMPLMLPLTATLTLTATYGGTAAHNGEWDIFDIGEKLTVTATPDEGYVFVEWLIDTGDGSTAHCASVDAEYSFTITGDTSLTAVFAIGDGVPDVPPGGGDDADGGGTDTENNLAILPEEEEDGE